MLPKNSSNEITITRVYDAPIADVWEAWTDPDQVAQWWGPRGFTLTTHHKDLRVGGTWKYTMHGPDGADYPNTTVYLEIEPQAKLVYDHGANDNQPPMFRVTVLFSESGGQTTMRMTMALPTPEAAAATRKFVKQAGGNATWDRLAEYLARQLQGAEQFVIARSFEAPIEVVFEMWTDPAHLSQWLPPTGFSMEFLRADIRPGGRTFWKMTDNATTTMYGRTEYLDVERPHRIVYTQQFRDEHDTRVLRHPHAELWPATMLTTVLLTSEGPDDTRVAVTWECHGETTPAELAAFLEARGGMTAGWTGSFDKLDEQLASRSAKSH